VPGAATSGDASLLDETTGEPAYAQIQDRVREINELKARF
jgi:hypothetical protein